VVETLANTIGLVGIALLVLAYWMLSTERLGSKDWCYHMLNFIGAVMHLVSLMVFWNLPSFVIECFWISISVYGLWHSFKPKRLG
jgi:hypothetical protein